MVVLNKAKYFSVVTKSQVIHLFQKTEIEYIPIYQSTKNRELCLQNNIYYTKLRQVFQNKKQTDAYTRNMR